MTKILVGAMAGAAVALFVYMLTRIDSGGVAMLIGLVFGMLAGIPSALLVLASSRRQAGDHVGGDDDVDLDYDQMRRRDMRRLRQQQGERELPPYPYQPPVIVLAAPMEDKPHVVNTYNDNRSVTIHTGGASSVPTIYDRQRQIAAQQGGRVFRVVGGEEWDE